MRRCFPAVLLFLQGALGSSETVGNVRIHALSPSLVRIEPKGPSGFEDRPTFGVVGRNAFEGTNLTVVNTSAAGTWMKTPTFFIFVNESSSALMEQVQGGVDVRGAKRSITYPFGTHTKDEVQCFKTCENDTNCLAWVFHHQSLPTPNCWPLGSYESRVDRADRSFGCLTPGCLSPVSMVTITSLNGTVLWTHVGQPDVRSNLLDWPAPLSSGAYAVMDYPRIVVPPWGPTPVPSNTTVDPDLVATNGYDFRNNQYGDTYVFLLGSTLEDWYASRRAFLQLTGPTPLLPDYAFGTWFTWWYPFSEGSAEDNVTRWDKEALPLDVWGLDMNWRNTSDHQDHFYDHPNTVLFPNFTGWFDFLETRKLKTYFNDHPFPVADQTHPEEVAFRTQGLFKWLGEGLTFWWFDRNWKFSIPPPGIAPVGGWNISYTGGDWEGLDNAAWGSHIYFANVDAYNRAHRPSTRTMTLTKWASRDYHESLPGSLHPQESLAQHRYPVWWTGDDITLEASVDTMIRAGLHGLKPYVHSDCGGDYRPKLSAGNLLRWTGHCVFAPILRFHGADHRPWSYGQGPLATIKSYLQLRYRLAPSLVAAAADTGSAATPLVARCDMFWPTFSEAASTTQYIFLNDFLVAPITDTVHNETSRSVWIPPGSWECIWSGETVTGPKTIKVTAPYERQPAWHRRGGLVVTSDDKALRLEDQDWSLLTIHAFPADADLSATRRIVDHATGVGASAGTMLTATSSASAWSLDIEPHPNGTPRAWHLRLHLAPTQHFVAAKVDGHDAEATLVGPADASSPPLAPRGVAPPPSSGAIVDIPLPPSAEGRRVQVLLR